MTTPETDTLRSFYERRHPAYHDLLSHWLFLEAAYRGGRAWFASNIFKYFKEGDVEFAKRLDRAYRFNHTREVVELVQKYLFKAEISRSVANAPDVIKEFWEKTTLNGLDIDAYMRTVSVANSIGGRCAVVVDNNFVMAEVVSENGETTQRTPSIAEAKAQNFRIYAYTVPAKDVLDYAFDEDGDGGLLWIKLRERVRDDQDPLTSSGDIVERVRLWTRTNWQLYEERDTGETVWNRERNQQIPVKRIELIDSRDHKLGIVPVILADHTIGEEPYRVPGLIDDIAYLDRAVANYLSNLDAIIQDQTFSQLAIPAQSIQPGEDMYSKVLELGTKRVFVFDGGAGSTAKPEYLSPDPKQAGVILTVINKIINEIYHTIGLAGERTKEDNAVGIDNSSGVAKAYDFERVNSLLLSKAQSCERVENQVVDLVLRWSGQSYDGDRLVTYPATFDVNRLVDELTTAEALSTLNAPIEVRREQMKRLIDKMFPDLKADLKKSLMDSTDKWLEGMDDPMLLAPPTKFGGASRPASAPNRQGEVTKNTPA